ncbi:MAG TPA: recombinase family protein [Candidatus Limnocylindria bacterium]|nr:recombinase family protein [Candidatus Limnocylindria bacterium]
MIAAIYARKSTDQNVADEEKSVTRQIERATAYAHAKGWSVAAGHVLRRRWDLWRRVRQAPGISGAG